MQSAFEAYYLTVLNFSSRPKGQEDFFRLWGLLQFTVECRYKFMVKADLSKTSGETVIGNALIGMAGEICRAKDVNSLIDNNLKDAYDNIISENNQIKEGGEWKQVNENMSDASRDAAEKLLEKNRITGIMLVYKPCAEFDEMIKAKSGKRKKKNEL